MSINTPNTEGYKDIFETSAVVDSSYSSYYDITKTPQGRYSDYTKGQDLRGSFDQVVSPNIIIGQISESIIIIHKVISEIDQFLEETYIDCQISPGLEESHHHVWSEVVNKSNTEVGENIIIANEKAPNYVSYAEYTYAKHHKCRGCRALVAEYDSYMSKTAISYYFTIKTILEYMLHELTCINNFVQTLIGDEYQDDTEQKITKELYHWSISTQQYTKQFAKEILSIPPKLPQSQVDIVSKVESAQFETFFSLQVNSHESEIKKLLGLLKREMVDTCEMYYSNYLGPAMKSRSMVAYPLELTLMSSTMKTKAPDLAQEVVMAASAINGNLASLMADLKQKRINTDKRINTIIELLREKRRYISYSRQFQLKNNILNKQIFISVEDDEYAGYFENLYSTFEKNETLNSSHGYFNDLLEDHHPQYLLRSGGTITGNVNITGNARIAGIDLANHTHSYEDGSAPIRASNIDYVTDRSESQIMGIDNSDALSVEVEAYSPDILVGGRPVVDVLVSAAINALNEDPARYSIQISYVEIVE
jgi:hypothetical protein